MLQCRALNNEDNSQNPSTGSFETIRRGEFHCALWLESAHGRFGGISLREQGSVISTKFLGPNHYTFNVKPFE
jgi:hypothetical protein